jgi:hypothetical protein
VLRVRQPGRQSPLSAEHGRSSPILLATLDVPFDDAAATLAVDTAVESGQILIVANAVELPPLPLSVIMGYDQLGYTPEMEASLLAPVRLAAALGVPVERIRVRSPRPVQGLLQVVSERAPGLLVFGPDRSRMSRRRYQRAARAIRDTATCLVWLEA